MVRQTRDVGERDDRVAYTLRPVYAVDEYNATAIVGEFLVIADDLSDAKEYVLEDTGRTPDSIHEWGVEEHQPEQGIPVRRESGIIRITQEEKKEFFSESGRHESACWICGPFGHEERRAFSAEVADDPDATPEDDDLDVIFSTCPFCGITTSFADLLDKREWAAHPDGTARSSVRHFYLYNHDAFDGPIAEPGAPADTSETDEGGDSGGRAASAE